jgi:hypothetical protein
MAGMVRGAVLSLLLALPGHAQTRDVEAMAVQAMDGWYRLTLELVRHTPTYSPPVAARAFGYLGVTGYEAIASGAPEMQTLAGQLNALTPLPARPSEITLDDAVVLEAALFGVVQDLFSNTGPTGQRAMTAMHAQLSAKAAQDLPPDVVAQSTAYGHEVAHHILTWAATDGGGRVENMGFPLTYALPTAPGHWQPTSKIVQQQAPLLPDWGNLRPFVLRSGAECALPGPPAFSESAQSAFYLEAQEVVEVTANLTDEQRLIARFWSDDPMLSPTPPGHWISIARDIMNRDGLPLAQRLDIMARLGMAISDGFVGCWNQKYLHNVLRPVTYIRKLIDPSFQPLLITPPFPEYPSGHSTQSGAAATVLTAILGDAFAFEDATHVDDGMAARSFTSFWQAANEAGFSRLYGGIHFRAAIVDGLVQGRCIGDQINALKTIR